MYTSQDSDQDRFKKQEIILIAFLAVNSQQAPEK